MKLLTQTNSYYGLLVAVLFALGGGVLYLSLNWALRNEVDEQLLGQQQGLLAICNGRQRVGLGMLVG